MVLSYYKTKHSSPLILDNLTSKITSAEKRKDLLPVYSFNDTGLWLERKKGIKYIGDSSKINLWADLTMRI